MGSKNTNPAINGSGARQCTSWIESFVEYTSNLETSPIYRKWAAISAIASVLEQKVWVTTSSPLYPNLYVFLVGKAGVGKSRAIVAALNFLREIPELFIGPTSMTMASLVDHLVEAKRVIINIPDPPVEYNSLLVAADELSAFMHEYSNDLIAGLTTFFDVVPYGQGRRTHDLRIRINRPQLNILSGTTPSNLVRFIPEYAWEQGFTSRVILVYSDDQPQIDIFNSPAKAKPKAMIHDLKVINTLMGEIGWTEDYAKAMHKWKLEGMPPNPEHPKLEYYRNRRFSHLLKLSMVACVDRGSDLRLNMEDFHRAQGWLIEAELFMPEIFRTGTVGADSRAMDEIRHFVASSPKGVLEHKLTNFARERVPAHAVMRVIEIMERSGMITATGINKQGLKIYEANGGL